MFRGRGLAAIVGLTLAGSALSSHQATEEVILPEPITEVSASVSSVPSSFPFEIRSTIPEPLQNTFFHLGTRVIPIADKHWLEEREIPLEYGNLVNRLFGNRIIEDSDMTRIIEYYWNNKFTEEDLEILGQIPYYASDIKELGNTGLRKGLDSHNLLEVYRLSGRDGERIFTEETHWRSGRVHFTDATKLNDFIRCGGNALTGRMLLNQADFDAHSLAGLQCAGGTWQTVSEWSDLTNDGFKIYRFHQLDLIPEDITTFTDTEKPNAVVVLPMDDHNHTYEKEGNTTFYRSVADHYDTVFLIAENEDEIYEALDDTPNISLWIPNGHGDGLTQRFGSGNSPISFLPVVLNFGYIISDPLLEKNFLDVLDFELGEHMANFEDDAVAFIRSCEAGLGLARFIRSHMPRGATVIAPLQNYGIGNLSDFRFEHPFDVSIKSYNGDDIKAVYGPKR